MIDSPLLPDRRTFGSDGAPYTAASKDLMERTAGFTGFYSSYGALRIIMGGRRMDDSIRITFQPIHHRRIETDQ